MNTNRAKNLCYVLFALTLVALIATAAGAAPRSDVAAAESGTIHLPVIQNIPAPTIPPPPPPPPASPWVTVTITPKTAINASTYNPNSFIIENHSEQGLQIAELRIDLSTAIFPNMVFDPWGNAGDKDHKDVTVDYMSNITNFSHHYEGFRDGGYDVLVLNFPGFNRNGRFAFSVDVDPTSIKGAQGPGPGESGSVGGLELVGATITTTFSNGETLTNQAYRMDDDGGQGPDHSGAVAQLRPGLPERPQIDVFDAAPPAIVPNPHQTVWVSGPAGRPVTVLIVEGGLFMEGVPPGGPVPGPFEANNALTTREYRGVIGPTGVTPFYVTLSKMPLPTGVTGFNIITATLDNHYGTKGLVAEPVVLRLP